MFRNPQSMGMSWILRMSVVVTRGGRLHPSILHVAVPVSPRCHDHNPKISSLIVPNLHANYPYPERDGGRQAAEYRVMREITIGQMRRVLGLAIKG